MKMLLLLAAAGAWAQVVPVTVGKAPNSSAADAKVYFAGQPASEDFAEYAKLDVKIVINLRTQAEMDKLAFNEAEAVKAAGMEYVNVPFASGTPPTDAALAKIFSYLKIDGGSKVLLHCATSNRAGMVWSLYRGSSGVGVDDAVAEGKAAGMKNPALEKAVRERLAGK